MVVWARVLGNDKPSMLLSGQRNDMLRQYTLLHGSIYHWRLEGLHFAVGYLEERALRLHRSFPCRRQRSLTNATVIIRRIHEVGIGTRAYRS